MNFSDEDRQRRAELKKQAERIFGTAPTVIDLAWTLLVLMTILKSCERLCRVRWIPVNVACIATHASEADA